MIVPNTGDRIELLAMPNDPCPVKVGTRGTVRNVVNGIYEGTKQVWVDWDWETVRGQARSLELVPRTLSLIIPPDEVRILEEGE